MACRKSLAEFAARRRQSIEIIFSRDMCVRENTAQARSSGILSQKLKIMRAADCKPFAGKNRRFFRQSQKKTAPAEAKEEPSWHATFWW
jgi:hypothetical protein